MSIDENKVPQTTVVLESGKDMSLSKFIEWLNTNFKKPSEREFTAQDAYGYILRQNLPLTFGRYKVGLTKYDEIGIKIVRVTKLD